MYSDWSIRMSYVTYQPFCAMSGGPLASSKLFALLGLNFETMLSSIGWNPGATGYGDAAGAHADGSAAALEAHGPGSCALASIVLASLRYVSHTVGIIA